MKFIFILSLIFLSAVVSQSPPESLLVTHPPFIAVGSLSPAVNVGVKGIESDITTNYQEMLTDHTKKLITVGAPEHVNVDDNLLIEKKYEDPVFVNKQGEEITASEAVAESEEAVDDGELAKIEEELAASQAETASEAHDLIMSKHSEVMKFLSTIAHTQRMNTNEEKLLDQVKRYLRLLKDRHFLIKDKAEEDIVQDLEIKIHEITFAIDQNDYAQKKLANKMKPINDRKAHEKMDLEADQTAELAERTLERGPEQVDNAVIAVLKVEYVAQRNAKVQQLRLLQDMCTAEVPFRNREAQSEYFANFKILLDAENKRLTEMMDNYDALIVLFKEAAGHLNQEEEEELEFSLQAIADHKDCEEDVYKTITLAQDALSKEDVTACETKLILGQNQVQEHLDSTILSFESVIAQQAILRKAAKQIVDGASWGESGIMDIDDLVEETLKRQKIIKFTPEIEEKTHDVLMTMRKEQYHFAISKMLDIVSKAKANGYTNILKDKNPLEHSDMDKIAINADKVDQKIYRLSDQANGYIKAGSWGSAFIRTELAGDQLQKRSKVKLIEKAARQAEKADDPVALEEIVTGLKTANTAELENMVAVKQSLAATKETIQTLQHRVEELERFEDAKQEVLELTHDIELSAQVRDSVLKAFQEISMDNRNMTRKYLVEAEDRLIIRESEVDFASDSIERQQEILNEILEETEEAGSDSSDVSEAEEELLSGFDKLKDEIQNHQNIVNSDNNIAERVEEIFQHLMFQEADPAAEKLRTLVGETIGFRPESVVEKQERQFGDDISKNQVPPDDEEPFTPTERMVEEIASDAAAAIETVNQLLEGEVSKEAAELEVEQLEEKIQRAEKLDDVKTTKAKILAAQDEDDKDGQLESIEDFVVSIEEEKVTLELLSSKCEAIRAAILDAQDQIENGEETNTKLAALLQEIKVIDGADAGVKEFVQQAIDSLALANKEKASLDLESAKDHLDRTENDYAISLDALGRQLGYLHDAKDAVEQGEDDVLENLLGKIRQSIDQQQLIFLTDKDARALREDAIREIVEGRIEDAIAAIQKLSDNADASLNEAVEEEHPEGEQQAEANAEATDAAAEAEEALEDEENVEGAQRAIEETAAAAQKAEKTEEVQGAKEDLAENEDSEVIDDLIETVEEEKAAIEEEKAALEETQEQLEETAEQIEQAEATPEEIEDELDEVDEEGLDGEALNAVQDAAEAAEEGDLQTAQEEVEAAAETAEEKQRDLEQSEELVERQVEKLEEAKEELENGDTEEALDLVQEVQDDTEEQEEVRVSEDIKEAEEEGIAAVAEGDNEEAQEAVEEIAEDAEDAEEEAAEEAAEEEAEAERAAELAANVPEEPDLEVAAGEVNALLNAVDTALHQEKFLRAQELVEEFDSEGDNFTEETQQELLEAIQNEDVEAAHALVQEIREAVNDTAKPTEYEFVKLPKSARNAKAKKSKQAKKQKVLKH